MARLTMDFSSDVTDHDEALDVLGATAVEWDKRERALGSVAQNGLLLARAPAELIRDHEVVATAVSENGHALKHAHWELQGDRSVVLKAVRQSGIALEFATPQMQADRELVLEAVAQNGGAMRFAAEVLREDRVFVLEAVARNARAISFASEAMLADPAFKEEALKRNSWCLGYFPKGPTGHSRDVILDSWHVPKDHLTHIGQASLLPGKHATEVPKPKWKSDLELTHAHS